MKGSIIEVTELDTRSLDNSVGSPGSPDRAEHLTSP